MFTFYNTLEARSPIPIIESPAPSIVSSKTEHSAYVEEHWATSTDVWKREDLPQVATGRPLPYAPKFTEELPKLIKVEDVEELFLQVAVDASPPAKIVWFINGFELKNSQKDEITTIEENRSTARLRQPIKEGEYKAVARNEVGIADTIGKIQVFAKRMKSVKA